MAHYYMDGDEPDNQIYIHRPESPMDQKIPKDYHPCKLCWSQLYEQDFDYIYFPGCKVNKNGNHMV